MFVEKIYSSLEALGQNNRRPRAMTASSILSCPRRIYFDIKGYDRSSYIDVDVQSKFWDGNLHHYDMERRFKEAKIRIVKKEFAALYHGLYARVDFLLEEPGTNDFYEEIEARKESKEKDFEITDEEKQQIKYSFGNLINVEFKSMEVEDYLLWKKDGIIAFPSYYAQCQIMAGSRPKRTSYVMVKDKNNSIVNEELIKPNFNYLNGLLDIKNSFDEHLADDTVPDIKEDCSDQECDMCRFQELCLDF